MSVLESFYFQFAADASSLKKGLAEADKSSADLEKNLQSADERASKLGVNLDKLAMTAGKALASLFALHELKKVTQETADHTYAVAQQARAMNMNVESLSAWQQAVKASGGTAEGATQSISGLRDKFVEMSRYGSMMGAEAFAFQQLGISAQDMKDSIQDPLIVMGKLADQFGKLDRTQALFLGKKLGLDQGSINLLMQGRRSMEELIARQKELGVVTQAQADAATKFEIAEVKAGMALETLKRELTSDLLPAFTWLIEKVEQATDFMRDHSGMMKTAATIVAISLAPALWGAATAAWALIAPMLIAAAPFIALGAAILLVADDIDTFIKGGDSMLGRIVQKWPIMGDIFRGIGAAARTMQDMLLKVVDQVLHPFQTFHDLIQAIFDMIKSAPSAVVKFIAGVTGGNYGKTGEPTAEKAAEAAQKAITTPNGSRGQEIAQKLQAMGWSPAQAAGMAGSLVQESQGKADAVNSKSGAYGVAQWLGSRVKDFKEFSGKDLKGSTLDEQLKFMDYELRKGKERAAGLRLMSAETPEMAAHIHRKYYERPGEEEANDARRVSYANEILRAQSHLASTQTPLNGMSSQAIANSTTNNRGGNSFAFQIGDIHTQATNAQELSGGLDEILRSHYGSAANFLDDGRLA